VKTTHLLAPFLAPCATVLLATLLVAPIGAHQLPLEVVAYVRTEGSVLRVLARVPAAVLADARLPIGADGYLDLAAIDGPLAAVASYVARSLDVMQDGRPLPAPRAAWVISRPPDDSFGRFESAAAHLATARLLAGAKVDPDTAFVDLDFEYALAPAATPPARFSIRVNDFRAANRAVQMRIHSMVDSAGERPISIIAMTGAPRRVALNPEWRSVLSIFGQMGLNELTLGVEHLLFLLCLAIPRRPTRSALSLLGVFGAGFLVALAGSALMSGTNDPARMLTLHAWAAGVLVVAALQNITDPRPVWLWTSSAVFGVVDGLLFGAVYRVSEPLAGSHTLVSLGAFAVPVLLASLWLLVVTKPAVELVYRLVPGPLGPGLRVPPGPEGPGLPESPGLRGRWATVLLSAIPIHAGLHGMGLF